METKRNVYLSMVGIEQAQDCLFENFGHLETTTESLDVVQARNRVLAEPAVAAISSPNFHASAMDGVAVDARTTFGASDEAPNR